MEDYSEGENGTTGSEKSHRLMYYPAPEDTVSNQFTVNAMDVEELRRFVVGGNFKDTVDRRNNCETCSADLRGGRKSLETEKAVGRVNLLRLEAKTIQIRREELRRPARSAILCQCCLKPVQKGSIN